MKFDRRSLKNIFVRPREQLSLGSIFIAAALMAQSAILLTLRPSLRTFLAQAEDYYRIPNGDLEAFRVSIESTLTWTASAGLAIGALALLYGIRISHQVFGPLVPIQRHIKNLAEGDFSSRVELRKGDHFQE